MKKYFLDTEFIEWAGGIDLVSIGIVCEDGRTFYAESICFDERNADQWVKDNVLSNLRWWNPSSSKTIGGEPPRRKSVIVMINGIANTELFGTLEDIRIAILNWIGDDAPEFYAYYADYDWVLLCRIFGRMITLPKGWPMFCIDLKQMMLERGLDKEWKRKHCPEDHPAHNALEDAKWNERLYDLVITKRIRPVMHSDGTITFFREDGLALACPFLSGGENHEDRDRIAENLGVGFYHHYSVHSERAVSKKYDKTWQWYKLNNDGTVGDATIDFKEGEGLRLKRWQFSEELEK